MIVGSFSSIKSTISPNSFNPTYQLHSQDLSLKPQELISPSGLIPHPDNQESKSMYKMANNNFTVHLENICIYKQQMKLNGGKINKISLAG